MEGMGWTDGMDGLTPIVHTPTVTTPRVPTAHKDGPDGTQATSYIGTCYVGTLHPRETLVTTAGGRTTPPTLLSPSRKLLDRSQGPAAACPARVLPSPDSGPWTSPPWSTSCLLCPCPSLLFVVSATNAGCGMLGIRCFGSCRLGSGSVGRAKRRDVGGGLLGIACQVVNVCRSANDAVGLQRAAKADQLQVRWRSVTCLAGATNTAWVCY